MLLQPYQEMFIKHLFSTGAIKFGKFKLKSGRISPYFINMSLAIKDGKGCAIVSDVYAQAIWKILDDKFDYIHGPAYKGIPLASLVAEKLWKQFKVNKRWGYDRKEKKTYGDTSEKFIVGDLRDGDRVLIIDDVITTGKTKVENWKKLSAFRKIFPVGVFVAVDREELSKEEEEMLKSYGLIAFSIIKISQIFEYLHYKSLITNEIWSNFKKYISQYGRK